jgi:hypothetical protein
MSRGASPPVIDDHTPAAPASSPAAIKGCGRRGGCGDWKAVQTSSLAVSIGKPHQVGSVSCSSAITEKSRQLARVDFEAAVSMPMRVASVLSRSPRSNLVSAALLDAERLLVLISLPPEQSGILLAWVLAGRLCFDLAPPGAIWYPDRKCPVPP